MKKKEIIKRLEKIVSIFDMSGAELVENFDFVSEKDLSEVSSIHVLTSGIAQGKLLLLIRDLKEKEI